MLSTDRYRQLRGEGDDRHEAPDYRQRRARWLPCLRGGPRQVITFCFNAHMGERADITALREAAALALSRWERIAGNGDGSSWLDQMREGKLPEDWPAGHASAVAELLSALGERARHTRAVAGLLDGSTPQPYAGGGFVQATHQRLPLNRKERYFTGTVLPGLIGDNGFAHMHRFLALCGIDVELQEPDSNPLDASQDIEFFTEYGFAESVHTSKDKARFADRPYERDTPDVVIVGPDWLLAVEAKVYHRPTREALEAQLTKQLSTAAEN